MLVGTDFDARLDIMEFPVDKAVHEAGAHADQRGSEYVVVVCVNACVSPDRIAALKRSAVGVIHVPDVTRAVHLLKHFRPAAYLCASETETALRAESRGTPVISTADAAPDSTYSEGVVVSGGMSPSAFAKLVRYVVELHTRRVSAAAWPVRHENSAYISRAHRGSRGDAREGRRLRGSLAPGRPPHAS